MRRLAVLGLAAAFVVVGAPGVAATSAPTSLRVTFWENSANPSSSVTWTLGCNPARGSLARPAVACRRLAASGRKLITPLPKDIVCTEIYGGPQKARVVGTLAGKRIWATFTRTNGCEIDRWSRVSPWLLPPGGVTS